MKPEKPKPPGIRLINHDTRFSGVLLWGSYWLMVVSWFGFFVWMGLQMYNDYKLGG